MKFTYKAYEKMIEKLKVSGYQFADYKNWREYSHPVILRHDIDNDISKAVKMATVEQIGGVKSTYYVLVTSDFYNIFSKESYDGLMKILDLGHDIGLHFDEVRYSDCEGNPQRVAGHIIDELKILEYCIGRKVNTVSMHRPSKGLLDANIDIPGVTNSYSQVFFRDFKYLSDSRRRWREPVDEIIDSRQFDKLHILTHAFWYNDEEIDIHDNVSNFINDGNNCRYRWMSSNITDLNTIMKPNEVMGI